MVDCLEELAGGHPFSEHMNIQAAVEVLQVKAEDWFDRDLVTIFTNQIPLCQTGTTVRLSDGSAAIVVSQNKGFPTRPVVRVFEDAAGKRVIPGYEVDLLKINNLVIV